MTLTFQSEPPPNRTGRANHDHHAIAAELRKRSGEWAIIASFPIGSHARTAAYRIRCGKGAAYQPAGAYEAVSRTNPDGGIDVWARHIGGGS